MKLQCVAGIYRAIVYSYCTYNFVLLSAWTKSINFNFSKSFTNLHCSAPSLSSSQYLQVTLVDRERSLAYSLFYCRLAVSFNIQADWDSGGRSADTPVLLYFQPSTFSSLQFVYNRDTNGIPKYCIDGARNFAVWMCPLESSNHWASNIENRGFGSLSYKFPDFVSRRTFVLVLCFLQLLG